MKHKQRDRTERKEKREASEVTILGALKWVFLGQLEKPK